jgi:glycosyltransferase involved in cell wall biosynthesis
MIIKSPELCPTPKVSVAMITYNHGRYVAQAVESALNQKTSFPFEVVVGDDCSRDDTREILLALQRKHPGKLQLLFHEANLGSMGKPNLAAVIAHCRGEYIGFLEGDDYWTATDKLQRQVDNLERHPLQAGCCHDVDFLGGEGRVRPWRLPYSSGGRELTVVDLVRHGFPHLMSLMVRRSTFPGLPPWYQDLGMGDWTIAIVTAQAGPIGFIPDASMGMYRLHSTSFWLTRDLGDRNRDEITAYRQFARHFAGQYAREFATQINRREFWEVDACLQRGDRPDSRRHFWRAFRNWPTARGVRLDWALRYFVRSHCPFLLRVRGWFRSAPSEATA